MSESRGGSRERLRRMKLRGLLFITVAGRGYNSSRNLKRRRHHSQNQQPAPEVGKEAPTADASESIDAGDAAPSVPIKLQWLNPEIDPNDSNLPSPNFRLASTSGFSVVRSIEQGSPGLQEQYRLYAVSGGPRTRWAGPRYRWTTDLFFDTVHLPQGSCYYASDPRTWDSRCIETLSLFSKQINCNQPGIACSQNDRWNAHPGTFNITALPIGGVWPNVNSNYGINYHTPVINKDKVNNVTLQPADTNCVDGAFCPPKTGTAATCHPISKPRRGRRKIGWC